MPQTVLTVASVRTVKTGERNGRAWTLLAVKDDSGREYTTFDAVWQDRVGQSVPVEYEIVKKDEYTNYRLKDEKPKKAGSSGGTDQVVALLTEIRDLLQIREEKVPF